MRAGSLPMAVQAESRAVLRPKAKSNIVAQQDDQQVLAEKNSKRELLIALFAVVLTLASAIPIIMLRPIVSDWMRYDDGSLAHPREFAATRDGGIIRYSPSKHAGKANMSTKPGAQYRVDLELLERRFKRGQFQMTGISGGDSIPEYNNMRRNAAALAYRVDSNDTDATLTITARTPEARAATTKYLSFLKERWTVGR